MKCPYCGEMIADGSQFCARCGNRLVSQSALTGAPGVGGAPGTASTPTGEQITSSKAVASLILGILVFIPFSAIAAIVLGHLALSEIRKSAGRLKGQGLATAGLIMGYVEIAMIPFVLIIAAIAIPNLLRARLVANEASAISTLRAYNRGAATYLSLCPDKGYPASSANLGPGQGDCEHANLIDSIRGSNHPVKSGYVFFYQARTQDDAGRVTRYTVNADPFQGGVKGVRHFFTDQTGVIRWAMDRPADKDSPSVGQVSDKGDEQ
jgi:type IV pilus assembly protein PilA